MKAISLLFFLIACAHEEPQEIRPPYEGNLVQCYLESDSYMEKKPFEAKVSMMISELGTITEAKILSTSLKDPNLNTCLTYAVLGAGRPLKTNEKAGPMVKEFKFRPEGNHEL